MYAKMSLALLGLILALQLVSPTTASAQNNCLILDKTVFAPGEPIDVRFSASADFPNNAWVGLIPSNVPHGSEVTNDNHDIQFHHLEGQATGVLTFTAPDQPGAYDLRMNDTDNMWEDGHEVASVSFTVQDERSGNNVG